jgi:hypothetical protein
LLLCARYDEQYWPALKGKCLILFLHLARNGIVREERSTAVRSMSMDPGLTDVLEVDVSH